MASFQQIAFLLSLSLMGLRVELGLPCSRDAYGRQPFMDTTSSSPRRLPQTEVPKKPVSPTLSCHSDFSSISVTPTNAALLLESSARSSLPLGRGRNVGSESQF